MQRDSKVHSKCEIESVCLAEHNERLGPLTDGLLTGLDLAYDTLLYSHPKFIFVNTLLPILKDKKVIIFNHPATYISIFLHVLN